jgi:hypothetical protein
MNNDARQQSACVKNNIYLGLARGEVDRGARVIWKHHSLGTMSINNNKRIRQKERREVK